MQPFLRMSSGENTIPEEVVGWLDALLDDYIAAPLRTPLKILLVVAVAALLLVLLRRMIAASVSSLISGGTTVRRRARRLLSRATKSDDPTPTSPLAIARRVQRAETIGSVMRSLSALLVGVIAVLAVLDILGWNWAPVLTSAGVLGVVLGFGAQTLVKDYLAGLFMIIEDQYGIGDVVDLGEASGAVEAIGLRVTQVRDTDGTLWYVRNGEVQRVGNKTQGWSRAVVDFSVDYSQDVDRVRALLIDAASQVRADRRLTGLMLGEPEVTGIEDVTAEAVRLRVMVKTVPGKQWEVAAVIRSQVRAVLGEAGVPLALPRREVVVERTVITPAAAEPGQEDPSGQEDPPSPQAAASTQGKRPVRAPRQPRDPDA